MSRQRVVVTYAHIPCDEAHAPGSMHVHQGGTGPRQAKAKARQCAVHLVVIVNQQLGHAGDVALHLHALSQDQVAQHHQARLAHHCGTSSTSSTKRICSTGHINVAITVLGEHGSCRTVLRINAALSAQLLFQRQARLGMRQRLSSIHTQSTQTLLHIQSRQAPCHRISSSTQPLPPTPTRNAQQPNRPCHFPLHITTLHHSKNRSHPPLSSSPRG